MLLGVFTPTEAASVTVAYILLITFVFYGGISWARLRFALFDTVKTTSAVLIIVSAAALFGWILTIEQLPQTFTRTILSISTDPLVLLLIVNVPAAGRRHVPRLDHGDAAGRPARQRRRWCWPASTRSISASSSSST